MFRVHTNLVLGHEVLDISHELFVQRGGRADRQGQAMNDKWITFREEAQLLAEIAADVNPVFGCDLHEIDIGRGIGHEFVDQRATQAEAGTVNRVL